MLSRSTCGPSIGSTLNASRSASRWARSVFSASASAACVTGSPSSVLCSLCSKSSSALRQAARASGALSSSRWSKRRSPMAVANVGCCWRNASQYSPARRSSVTAASYSGRRGRFAPGNLAVHLSGVRHRPLGVVLVPFGVFALRVEGVACLAQAGVLIGDGIRQVVVLFQLLDAVLGAIGIHRSMYLRGCHLQATRRAVTVWMGRGFPPDSPAPVLRLGGQPHGTNEQMQNGLVELVFVRRCGGDARRGGQPPCAAFIGRRSGFAEDLVREHSLAGWDGSRLALGLPLEIAGVPAIDVPTAARRHDGHLADVPQQI